MMEKLGSKIINWLFKFTFFLKKNCSSLHEVAEWLFLVLLNVCKCHYSQVVQAACCILGSETCNLHCKESINFSSRQVYQWSVAPLGVIGNTRDMMAPSFVNRFIWVTNVSTCSSRFESPSYLSIVNILHSGGRGVYMMSSTKGWSRCSTLWTNWVTDRVLSLYVLSTSSILGIWVLWGPATEIKCMLLSCESF